MIKIESTRWSYGPETEEILDFANMVFSMEYSSTDFNALLPKAYDKTRCSILTHHIIRENNKIRALIDCYPVTMKLNGEEDRELKAVYVGTVSVHPKSRKKGYMIELMKRAEEDAVREGCALMILDGSRHRYQPFGFERAGIQYSFQLDTNNIRHCCTQIYDKTYMASPVYSFAAFQERSPYLKYLYELYQYRTVTARTQDDFLRCLQSYHGETYVILKEDIPVGYVNLSEDKGNILEIELKDIQELPRVVYDLMMDCDLEQLDIRAGMDETDKIEQLQKMCDCCNSLMSHQIKILDYEAVLEFLLKWKQKYCTLAICDYVIGVRDDITGIVENYLLSVSETQIQVSHTKQSADTVFEALELVRVLTTNLFFVEQHKIKNAPAGWFPLPFYLPEADTF
ncbi:MAG: GNAT family N-acetyltransferase [Lachnospiraceae bacterium]|nr:GNAT family N-acetyltransferase [Lachnospiraceae bacterium]